MDEVGVRCMVALGGWGVSLSYGRSSTPNMGTALQSGRVTESHVDTARTLAQHHSTSARSNWVNNQIRPTIVLRTMQIGNVRARRERRRCSKSAKPNDIQTRTELTTRYCCHTRTDDSLPRWLNRPTWPVSQHANTQTGTYLTASTQTHQPGTRGHLVDWKGSHWVLVQHDLVSVPWILLELRFVFDRAGYRMSGVRIECCARQIKQVRWCTSLGQRGDLKTLFDSIELSISERRF